MQVPVYMARSLIFQVINICVLPSKCFFGSLRKLYNTRFFAIGDCQYLLTLTLPSDTVTCNVKGKGTSGTNWYWRIPGFQYGFRSDSLLSTSIHIKWAFFLSTVEYIRIEYILFKHKIEGLCDRSRGNDFRVSLA